MSNHRNTQGPPIEALYALAYAKMERESYFDAACLLRLMLHLAPADERAWLALGLCHQKTGQLDAARELYATGSVAAMPSGRCTLALARVLAEQGQHAAAEAYYNAALEAFDATHEEAMAQLTRAEIEVRP